MKFIGDTLGASLLGECLSDLSRSFYKSHFGLPFWELFLDSFWASILGTFLGKFLGFHFGNNLRWKVFELPFWEPLFLESVFHTFTYQLSHMPGSKLLPGS